ncbi:hypothetical protein DFJ74DRAFT_73094 [Hyaloraphidium curvatum]|nr:hypothetical protein DFJ74DRAFT_73094 [Hyaloraphidium curvatum]
MPVDHHELSAHVAVDVHVSAPGGPNVPGDVCIVLGFTGGSIKLLKRAYSSPYLAAGLHVVTFATPVPPMSRKVAEKELADVFSSPVWQSLFSEPRKLVIHAMSGGGSIHLTHMLRLQPQLVPLTPSRHSQDVHGLPASILVGDASDFGVQWREIPVELKENDRLASRGCGRADVRNKFGAFQD